MAADQTAELPWPCSCGRPSADGCAKCAPKAAGCPFCGGADLYDADDEDAETYPTRFYVYCGGCEARGPEVAVARGEHSVFPEIRDKYRALARERWETRT